MMAYASRTGTRRNIVALKAAGWGWMVGPLDMGGGLHGMPYALDNGAWPAFAQDKPWDAAAFERALETYGAGADFIVVPDVVGDREASLARTIAWLPRLLAIEGPRLLIAIQDGMDFADIEPLLTDPRIGIFIGGTTDWKISAIIPWGRWAKARDLYVHVGRVNTAKRIALCAAADADSFDGTSVTRFACNLPMLDGARKQADFEPLTTRRAAA